MAFPIIPIIKLVLTALPEIIRALKKAPFGKKKEAAKEAVKLARIRAERNGARFT